MTMQSLPTQLARCLNLVKADRHLIGYSTGNFGKNLLLGSVDVTLLFLLTDLLGIAPQSVSLLMAVVFVGDLMFDLAAGLLATWAQNSGTGYRRLIALGTLPCAAAFALIYSLPLLGLKDIAVITLAILVFRAAYAIIDVPHNSLLTRVATGSHARGRASGYRAVFSSTAGVVIASVLVSFMGTASQHATPGLLSELGMVGGLLFCTAMFFAAWSSKVEGADSPRQMRTLARMVFLPRLDRLFTAIAVIALITGFATSMFAKMIIYMATYVLNQPALAGRILLALTLGQLAGAALWIFLIRSHDKTTLLATSHGVAACGILLFFAAGENQPLLMVFAVLIGIGLGGVFMLPWGILADIVDFAEFRHRERRETAAFASILVILKASGAASVATIGWTLGELGYVPGVTQPESVVQGMKLLAFGVPALGSIIAILTLQRFAVGHLVHARVARINGARRHRVGGYANNQ
jgi:GPH family glycoside/pentoside/hexuronide:cation symporter